MALFDGGIVRRIGDAVLFAVKRRSDPNEDNLLPPVMGARLADDRYGWLVEIDEIIQLTDLAARLGKPITVNFPHPATVSGYELIPEIVIEDA